MSPDHFVRVFDVLESGYRTWTFPTYGLAFVVVGIIIFAFPKIITFTSIPYFNFPSKLQRVFRYGFLGFAILWTTIAFLATYLAHLHHKSLVQENKCLLVEGPVENFATTAYGVAAQESFSVSGVKFEYSDFDMTNGFNNTSLLGGPINSESYVRICYDPSSNVILRLDIRNFKGAIKDYSKAVNIFSPPEDVRIPGHDGPAIDIPWHGNLFVVLLLLDIAAIHALYLPYLRTFFRVKTVPIGDRAIPRTLEHGKKIKLRNNMIYWDREHRAIWMRPRGLNLFLVPQMTALLNVDSSGTSVAEYEIRFSSGYPLAMASFLWAAYLLILAIQSTGIILPSTIVSLSIAAGAVLAVGLVHLRVGTSRMERLVQDALLEFKKI
jgi:hypothetical protein